MRISDWISDVCSSDLLHDAEHLRRIVAIGEQFADRIERGPPVTPPGGAGKGGKPGHKTILIYTNVSKDRRSASQYGATYTRIGITTNSADALSFRSEEHTSELQSLLRHTYAVL